MHARLQPHARKAAAPCTQGCIPVPSPYSAASLFSCVPSLFSCVSEVRLRANLDLILEDARTSCEACTVSLQLEQSVGVLTSEKRPVWHELRSQLCRDQAHCTHTCTMALDPLMIPLAAALWRY